jgi:hypothetical protein
MHQYSVYQDMFVLVHICSTVFGILRFCFWRGRRLAPGSQFTDKIVQVVKTCTNKGMPSPPGKLSDVGDLGVKRVLRIVLEPTQRFTGRRTSTSETAFAHINRIRRQAVSRA